MAREERGMSRTLVVEETPMQFFREQLERAMEHQKVSTSAFTEYYLVNLLTRCVQGDALPAAEPGYDEMPLALLYVRALDASRQDRARLLRGMGDMALFVSGFFAESLNRRVADLSYYRAMGGQAYSRLSQEEAPFPFDRSVFSELAFRFSQFADLLSEVSETSQLAATRSVMVLYERWLQTGSRRAAALLEEQGITPVSPGEGRPQ
jgi:hypothetical protein